MSMTQIAILFEISGFIIASVFAGILLERGAVESIADKVNDWIKLTANTLDKEFPLPPPKALTMAAWYAMFSLFLALAVVSIVIGWLNNFWLFFLGGLALILGFFTPAVLILLSSKNRLDTAKGLAKQLLFLLITIPMLLFTAGITTLRLMLKWLAGKDMLKKAFLVFGTAMLLAGLILEFVATL